MLNIKGDLEPVTQRMTKTMTNKLQTFINCCMYKTETLKSYDRISDVERAEQMPANHEMI